MARATRKATLETRSGREALAKGKRHSVSIARGLALVYRRPRGSVTAGTWYVRIALDGNRYQYKSIGEADDHRDANGSTILDYFQAQERARASATTIERERSEYTVERALSDYFEHYPGRAASVPRIRSSVEPRILPALGSRPVNALTTAELETWRAGLVEAFTRIRGEKVTRTMPAEGEARDEYTRRRKVTANRVYGALRAALNRAWRDRTDIPTNDAWAKVRPFRAVSRGRVDYLTQAQARKLMAECPPDLRTLVRGALLTGVRPGELRAIHVEDYGREHRTVFIRHPKVDKCRHVPLNTEGWKFFDRLTTGRNAGEPMFRRADGLAWAKDDPRRPLAEACKAVKMKPINMYTLRHTFATLLLAENVSMHYLAKLMGTSVKMIEDHYGHVVEKMQRATVAKLPSFGLEDSKVARIA